MSTEEKGAMAEQAAAETKTADDVQAEQFDWTDPGAVMSRLSESGQFGDDVPGGEPEAKPEADAAQAEDATDAAEPADVAEEADSTPAGSTDDDESDTPRGVQTKSKGRVLPYHVLEDARREAKQFKQQVTDLETQLEQMRQTGAPASSAATQEMDPGVKEVFDRLNAEDGYFDEDVVKALNYARQSAESANARVVEYERQAEQQRQQQQAEAEQAQADEARAEHEEAIGDTPQLKKIWDAGGPLADQAQAISSRMLQDQSYKYESRVSHYKDVERELCDMLGIKPQEAAPKQESSPKKPLPEPEAPEPASLSDIPGGAAPETGEGETFMQMDGMKAVSQLAKMSPAQQSEFIRRAFGG